MASINYVDLVKIFTFWDFFSGVFEIFSKGVEIFREELRYLVQVVEVEIEIFLGRGMGIKKFSGRLRFLVRDWDYFCSVRVFPGIKSFFM